MTGSASPGRTGRWPVLAVRGGKGGVERGGSNTEASLHAGKAAELEHLIMLTYLSRLSRQGERHRRSSARRVSRQVWRQTLLNIGEQETPPALVQNLLTSVGAARALPARTSRCRPTATRRVSASSLLPFVKPRCATSPSSRARGMDVEDAEGFRRCAAVALPHDERMRSSRICRVRDDRGALRVDRAGLDIWQVGLARSACSSGRRMPRRRGALPVKELVAVTDLASAARAIDTIVEQGEGARGVARRPFGRLLGILDEYLAISARTPLRTRPPVVAANVRPQATGVAVPLSPIRERHAAWTS